MIHSLFTKISRVFILSLFIISVGGFLTTAMAGTRPASSNKKGIHSRKKSAPKKKPILHMFKAILEKVDLQDHPMTLTAMRSGRNHRKKDFVWNLTPQTTVFSQGKSVGVKSLQKDERVLIFYHKISKKLFVVKVRILGSPAGLKHHH
jgi:hypothetical protein